MHVSKAADVKNRPGISWWFISFTALLALEGIAVSILNQRDLRPASGSILFLVFVIGAVALYRRIREQEQLKAAVREEEDKLRLVLDSTAEGIYGVDLNGSFTFCNRAALKLLGYKAIEDLMGQKCMITSTTCDPTAGPIPHASALSWRSSVTEKHFTPLMRCTGGAMAQLFLLSAGHIP